eukprot:TRINITY_DN22595_c0_g1_i1.p1 TRINITY_DN22595_c0_g1~~TRINITY_DN22595_c0_g1_i1.p1  ORF type:complete len:709 (+),score=329.78 TRINITY_DN22595_c0_g1_i1:270-2129(+)
MGPGVISPQIPLQTKATVSRRPLPALGEEPKKTATRKKRDQDRVQVMEAAAAAVGGSRDMMTQTDYRENDTQTDPYTPDYCVEDGEQPQVLALMELRYGAGLPAGIAEVEMIDRVKRRTQVESQLPQGPDEGAMHTRLQALEELEQVEWGEREAHIKQLQEKRLAQMAHALEKREAKREHQNATRIETVKQQKLDYAETRLNRLQDKRMTATRKLGVQHSNPAREQPKVDIIASYSKHGARGKEVQTSSLVEKSTNCNYDVRPTLLGFPEGVQELEKTKAPKLQKVKVKDIEPPVAPAVEVLESNFKKRAAKQVIRDLEYAKDTIEKAKGGGEAQMSIQDFYRATPRLIRPDTPTLVLQGDQDEEKEEALVLLQRLLRGRAVQNEFFEGKERCHGLIEELQAASRAKETEQLWAEAKELEAQEEKKKRLVDDLVDHVQGDILFGTMDYLGKELTRQGEVAKFETLKGQAEKTRQERENAEGRLREEELRRRAQEDAQYRTLLAAHDYTAHTYLSNVFELSVRATAYEHALLEEVSKYEAELAEPPKPAKSEEERRLQNEQLVCDLMDAFVIPQVKLEIGKKDEKHGVLHQRAMAHEAKSSCYDVATAAIRNIAWKDEAE